MIKYLQVPVGKHGTINVEIKPTEDSSGFEELGISKDVSATTTGFEEDLGLEEVAQTVTARATKAFEKMTETIHALAYGFRERMDQLEEKVRPDEVSVEFGLSLKADAGVVIAQAGADASFKITVAWKASLLPQGK